MSAGSGNFLRYPNQRRSNEGFWPRVTLKKVHVLEGDLNAGEIGRSYLSCCRSKEIVKNNFHPRSSKLLKNDLLSKVPAFAVTRDREHF